MRRLLLGLLLGALIFGVAFAGAKVATVTNPMSGDLDGGGYRASNLNSTLWLRNDGLGHGQLWLKTGSGDCDWTLVAGAP